MSLKELLGLSNNGTFFGPVVAQRPQVYSNKLTYDDLINAESALGRTLFGPIPVGHRREFFKHKENTWIWYESWINEAGIEENITIRYEVRPAGVYKKTPGKGYVKIEGEELKNFRDAANRYLELVKTKLYC